MLHDCTCTCTRCSTPYLEGYSTDPPLFIHLDLQLHALALVALLRLRLRLVSSTQAAHTIPHVYFVSHQSAISPVSERPGGREPPLQTRRHPRHQRPHLLPVALRLRATLENHDDARTIRGSLPSPLACRTCGKARRGVAGGRRRCARAGAAAGGRRRRRKQRYDTLAHRGTATGLSGSSALDAVWYGAEGAALELGSQTTAPPFEGVSFLSGGGPVVVRESRVENE